MRAAVNENKFALKHALLTLRIDDLRAYVLGLLSAYTTPSSLFLGTFLCGTNFLPTPALDISNGARNLSVAVGAHEEACYRCGTWEMKPRYSS